MRLIYLSPVPWRSYAQRPHFMVRQFLSCGGQEVLWIDPYPGRLPRLTDFRRPRGLHDQGTASDPRIRVCNFQALPCEPLPGGFSLNRWLFSRKLMRKINKFTRKGNAVLGIGKPSALALTLLQTCQYRWSFYDAMDDFPLFHTGFSRSSMARLEQAICCHVSDIFVSSSSLEQKFAGGPVPVTCIRNGFDPAILPTPTTNAQTVRLIFGYIGSMGRWFDWDSVIALARAVPFSEVRLIGPQLEPPPRSLPVNIKFFPACRHEEIGSFLSEFGVGLIPFLKTPLTQGVDPIKFYEYRAMGLPILSTTFGEMERRKCEPGVFFMDGSEGSQVAIQNVVSYKSDSEALVKWRAENSWSARFSACGLFSSLFTSTSFEQLR